MIQRGMQIVYVPPHTDQPIFTVLQGLSHLSYFPPTVQFGFVTSVREGIAFCRYWKDITALDLRTMANSEATPVNCLIAFDITQQPRVDELVEWLTLGEVRQS